MPTRFDINTKPLNKAKPCITQLIRDDGSIEWYEGCKPGQLLQIKTADHKAYINLDYHKILNFNKETTDVEYQRVKEALKIYEDYKTKLEKEEEEANNKISKIQTNPKLSLKKQLKLQQAEEKKQRKRERSLKDGFVKLVENKIRNLGNTTKPILGFIAYEKEFNALPYKEEHDSKAISQWLDDVLKNKKDFQAQRVEASGKMIFMILVGLAIAAFVIFKWVVPNLPKKAPEPAQVQQTVATIEFLLPITLARGQRWLTASFLSEKRLARTGRDKPDLTKC